MTDLQQKIEALVPKSGGGGGSNSREERLALARRAFAAGLEKAAEIAENYSCNCSDQKCCSIEGNIGKLLRAEADRLIGEK